MGNLRATWLERDNPRAAVQRGERADDVAAAAGDDPLHADDAVPGAAQGPAAHGGLTGVPQVSVPGASVDGLPVGLSIVGGHGSDAALVAVARALEAAR
jgi:Asp-tRNA(Asn)/Glu-tRNA(Gln) amidotransferase A subunit family amidase